jgi:hypothetical protein
MTGPELASALAELGLRHDAAFTRAVLGIGGRQIRYYLAGRSPVPRSLETLIGLLLVLHRSGIPLHQVSTLVGARGKPLGAPPPPAAPVDDFPICG